MAYREVTMIEITEVLRQWVAGAGRKQIARRLGLDPKTVRRYLRAAERCGLRVGMTATTLTDERVTAILSALWSGTERSSGPGWQRCGCEQYRSVIEERLRAGVRPSKIRHLLLRQEVTIPAATLYRFATAVLGVGRAAATIPVANGAPGEELRRAPPAASSTGQHEATGRAARWWCSSHRSCGRGWRTRRDLQGRANWRGRGLPPSARDTIWFPSEGEERVMSTLLLCVDRSPATAAHL